jgi:hypothetical protein
MSRRLLKTALILAIFATVAHAFSSGPPAGVTGAPGEGTCVQCHTGTLNSGGGSIVIEGVPDQYEPGAEITLTVRVRHPDRRRWGFQLTALNGNNRGVGTFALVDRSTTRLVEGVAGLEGRTYVEHTSAGTFEGEQSGVWQVRWTAPAEDAGLITFYAAGNASNGNNASSGDSIYTTAVVSGTATPAVIAPAYKKGKILLQANNSNILPGATLEVTAPEAAEPEIFTLTSKGSRWIVKKKARSTPGDLRVDDILTPGTTVTLVIRNPDGTPSAPAELTR